MLNARSSICAILAAASSLTLEGAQGQGGRLSCLTKFQRDYGLGPPVLSGLRCGDRAIMLIDCTYLRKEPTSKKSDRLKYTTAAAFIASGKTPGGIEIITGRKYFGGDDEFFVLEFKPPQDLGLQDFDSTATI